MDNRVESWAPARSVAVVAWSFAAVCLLATALLLVSGDSAGPILLGTATIALVALACYTTFARPRLAADHAGLRVRTLAGIHRFGWSEVAVRLATTRRLGREVTTLEIDAAEHDPPLIVLGRLELDADPADVLSALDELRG